MAISVLYGEGSTGPRGSVEKISWRTGKTAAVVYCGSSIRTPDRNCRLTVDRVVGLRSSWQNGPDLRCGSGTSTTAECIAAASAAGIRGGPRPGPAGTRTTSPAAASRRERNTVHRYVVAYIRVFINFGSDCYRHKDQELQADENSTMTKDGFRAYF